MLVRSNCSFYYGYLIFNFLLQDEIRTRKPRGRRGQNAEDQARQREEGKKLNPLNNHRTGNGSAAWITYKYSHAKLTFYDFLASCCKRYKT